MLVHRQTHMAGDGTEPGTPRTRGERSTTEPPYPLKIVTNFACNFAYDLVKFRSCWIRESTRNAMGFYYFFYLKFCVQSCIKLQIRSCLDTLVLHTNVIWEMMWKILYKKLLPNFACNFAHKLVSNSKVDRVGPPSYIQWHTGNKGDPLKKKKTIFA